jgi:site-specific DNA-cytosine methylase
MKQKMLRYDLIVSVNISMSSNYERIIMNVLSLFDGMSCGQLALKKVGIHVSNYYASEIDKHSIAVTQHNFPRTQQVGDVCSLKSDDLQKIDLLIGGSPCQSISNLGDGTGLDGKSGLFYQYLRLKQETNPKYFLLENVVGNKKSIDKISELLQVNPVLFNSNKVSAQNRARYYWTNIEFKQPINEYEFDLKDILDEQPASTCELSKSRLNWLLSEKGQASIKKKYTAIDPKKANCLTARSDASWNCNYVTRNGVITKLTCEEYEKLQTVPTGYTSVARTSERYKMLGNGWTVDVIASIFKGITYETNN